MHKMSDQPYLKLIACFAAKRIIPIKDHVASEYSEHHFHYDLYQIHENKMRKVMSADRKYHVTYFSVPLKVGSLDEFYNLVVNQRYNPFKLIMNPKKLAGLADYLKDKPDSIGKTLLLAFCYNHGNCGVEKDYYQALALFFKAYESDDHDPRIANNIGYYYDHGFGCQKNLSLAIEWYQKGADMLYAPSLHNLGIIYRDGIGVEQNYKKAIELFFLAAKMQFADSQYALGICILEGKGIVKNFDSARYWLQMAAYQDHPKAIGKLGELLENKEYPCFDLNTAFRTFLDGANLGDGFCQFKVGFYYYRGLAVKKSFARALYHLTQAANNRYYESYYYIGLIYEQGDHDLTANPMLAFKSYQQLVKYDKALGNYCLGNCYYCGIGVEIDYSKARYYYSKSAKYDYLKADYRLGIMALRGEGMDNDYQEAMARFQKCVQLENSGVQALSEFYLASIYQEGLGVAQDDEKAAFWYEKAASHGSIDANIFWGLCLINGKGVTADPTRGKEYLKRYIKHFDKEAFNNHYGSLYLALGKLYLQGTYVKRKPVAAYRYFENATKAGNIEAMYFLGQCLQNGSGISANPQKAVSCFIKAAEAGVLEAQYSLANCYYDGGGVNRDYQKAVFWYKKAALQGHPNAQCSLGNCYAEGQGVKKDYHQAMNWYSLAADHGHALAYYNLGYFYEKGIGVLPDLDKAQRYYESSLHFGYVLASVSIERVNKIQELIKLSEAGAESTHIFISWNHHSQSLSLQIKKVLEAAHLKVWHSDSKCEGNISETCLLAIKSAKSFLVILSLAALESHYVALEVKAIYERVRNKEIDISCVRALYDGDEAIIKDKIKELPSDNPFHLFVDYDLSPLYYSSESNLLVENVINMLGTGQIKAYRKSRIKKSKSLSLFIMDCLSFERARGMLNTTTDIADGYVSRFLIPYRDDASRKIDENQLLTNRISLIIAPAGHGKTVYLQNLEHCFFSLDHSDNFFFRFTLRSLQEYIDSHNQDVHDGNFFLSFLKNYVFKRELDDLDNQVLLTNEKFLQLFTNEKKNIYLLLDAVDELGANRKARFALIVKMLDDFLIKFDSSEKIHLIFTSRVDERLSFSNIKYLYRYILPPFNDDDRKNVFQSIMEIFNRFNHYSSNHQDEALTNLISFSYDEDYQEFANHINEIDPDIINNPLLLSNMIVLYFVNRLENKEMPNSEYELMMQAIDIMIDGLEDSKKVELNYESEVLANGFFDDHLRDILSYLYFNILSDDHRDVSLIIEDYLKKEKNDDSRLSELSILDLKKIAKTIANHLISRNFAGERAICHALFATYFASEYCYNELYEIKHNSFYAYLSLKNYDNGPSLMDYGQKVLNRGGEFDDVLLKLLCKITSVMALLPKENDDLSSENKDTLSLTMQTLFQKDNFKKGQWSKLQKKLQKLIQKRQIKCAENLENLINRAAISS